MMDPRRGKFIRDCLIAGLIWLAIALIALWAISNGAW
jgi:hypothetical protein